MRNTTMSNRSTARRQILQNIGVKLTVWRENKPTDVDETASEKSLRYRVAKFRAAAEVTFPKISTHETWQVSDIGKERRRCRQTDRQTDRQRRQKEQMNERTIK